MAAFERVKSGIPQMDTALDSIRLGDNVVWRVSDLSEFRLFMEPYVRQAVEDHRNIIYTLMETAKANNLRLEAYIEHLLAVLPERFADDLEADIDDLLPWADAMQKMFAMFGTGT